MNCSYNPKYSNIQSHVNCVYNPYINSLSSKYGNLILVGDFNSYMALREKCPYSELFWSAFSLIRIEYREIPILSPYSFRMRQNTDLNNSEYGHLLRSVEHSPMITFCETYKLRNLIKHTTCFKNLDCSILLTNRPFSSKTTFVMEIGPFDIWLSQNNIGYDENAFSQSKTSSYLVS